MWIPKDNRLNVYLYTNKDISPISNLMHVCNDWSIFVSVSFWCSVFILLFWLHNLPLIIIGCRSLETAKRWRFSTLVFACGQKRVGLIWFLSPYDFVISNKAYLSQTSYFIHGFLYFFRRVTDIAPHDYRSTGHTPVNNYRKFMEKRNIYI